MVLIKFLLLLMLFSGLKVKAQFSTSEIIGSGDGMNENSTYSRLPLLDDNGDISTVVTGSDKTEKIEGTEMHSTDSTSFPTDTTAEETTLYTSTNDTVTDITVTENSKTTLPATNPSTIGLRTSDDLDDTTTQSTLTTSYITETSTLADTTTEDSTTKVTATTLTTKITSKKPIKTDSATDIINEDFKTTSKHTSDKNSPSSSLATTTESMSDTMGERCTFLDTALKCNRELVCYGDGEIDCTDNGDNEVLDNVDEDIVEDLLPSLAVLGSDVIEGGTSEVYPIRRIDGNSMKIDLFRMLPLIPTYFDVSTEEYDETTTTPMPFINNTVPMQEEVLDGGVAEVNSTDMLELMSVGETGGMLDYEDSEEFSSFSTSKEFTQSNVTIYDDGKPLPSINNLSETDFSYQYEDVKFGDDGKLVTNITSASDIETPVNSSELVNNQENASETSSKDPATTLDLTTTSVSSENFTGKDKKEQATVSRTKRDKSANDSNGHHISNYKVSELGSSKKKLKAKLCKLSGSVVCFPRPTLISCSGKTVCQVTPQQVETVENPASPQGLEKWTIAVIVVCAISAFFTVALLFYLIFTSYKKLKVQPQNGVTTLNYFNSTQP